MVSRRLSLVALVALVAIVTVSPVLAADGQSRPATSVKIDRALSEALASGSGALRVIVTIAPGFRDGVRDALKKHGDVVKSEHPSIESIAAIVHRDDVAELAAHPGINYISFDAPVSAGSTSNDFNNDFSTINRVGSSTRLQLAASTLRETLGLPARPSVTTPTGAGITVALIDSGIDPSGFSRRITAFYDFTRGGIPVAAFDDYGHGTHIAGLIGEQSSPYMGIAPDVNFVGLKVLDKDGVGTTSDVIKALEYVTANRSRLGVQIVNLSLGHPIFAPASHDPLVAAVERATSAGLIVVVSAGNFGVNPSTGQPGYTGITSPGNAPSAITVGAADTKNTTTRGDDVVAPFSSRGPSWFDGFAKPDVVAPGVHLTSDAATTQTLYNLLTNNRVTASGSKVYLQLSGTSMAAGVTTGVVALILDAHDRANYYRATPLTANVVKAILEYSAIPLSGFDVLTQGTGEINANGAIALGSAIDTGADHGTYWLRAAVPGFSSIGGVWYEWSKEIIWGNQLLKASGWASPLYFELTAWTDATRWGANIVWSTRDNIVWGTADDNIVWGTADGDNIVWGTNIVWSDRLVGFFDGDNIVWGTAARDNIVWGTVRQDNIVWGTLADDNIVWGTMEGDNIVWGTMEGDNIVWGTAAFDNIVWGTSEDNIVWGTISNIARLGGTF